MVFCQICYIFASVIYNINGMTIAEQILDYAAHQMQTFRRRDLMQFLESKKISVASAHVLLKRLVEQGKLIRVGHGIYSKAEGGKTNFIYRISEEEQKIAEQVKEKFPFVKFCVWKPSVLTPYMRHVPANRMLIVDVERTAMESVFSFLQGNHTDMHMLLNPTSQECERYITTDSILIVRTLINEAPVTVADDTPVPTLEKILVDTTKDKELVFAQGAELYTIYEEAFSCHNVNRSRLLRYATRRHRKEQVLKIINAFES